MEVIDGAQLWYASLELSQQSDEFRCNLPPTEHLLPEALLGKHGKEFEVLVYTLVHPLHIPQIERKVFRASSAHVYLSLQEDERTCLRDDVLPELREYEVEDMQVDSLRHTRR